MLTLSLSVCQVESAADLRAERSGGGAAESFTGAGQQDRGRQ